MCFTRLILFLIGESPKKTRKTFPFLYNSAKNSKFLESLEQKLLSFFLKNCADEGVDHLVKILKQSIDEYTNYSELKNEQKNCSWFDNFVKNLLKKNNSLRLELIATPIAYNWKKYKELINKVNYAIHFENRLHFSEKLTNFLGNKSFVFKQLSSLSEREPSIASLNLKNGVLIKNEKDCVEFFDSFFLPYVLKNRSLLNQCLRECLLRAYQFMKDQFSSLIVPL